MGFLKRKPNQLPRFSRIGVLTILAFLTTIYYAHSLGLTTFGDNFQNSFAQIAATLGGRNEIVITGRSGAPESTGADSLNENPNTAIFNAATSSSAKIFSAEVDSSATPKKINHNATRSNSSAATDSAILTQTPQAISNDNEKNSSYVGSSKLISPNSKTSAPTTTVSSSQSISTTSISSDQVSSSQQSSAQDGQSGWFGTIVPWRGSADSSAPAASSESGGASPPPPAPSPLPPAPPPLE